MRIGLGLVRLSLIQGDLNGGGLCDRRVDNLLAFAPLQE